MSIEQLGLLWSTHNEIANIIKRSEKAKQAQREKSKELKNTNAIELLESECRRLREENEKLKHDRQMLLNKLESEKETHSETLERVKLHYEQQLYLIKNNMLN